MRAATQFWADGPAFETPPGHWNVLANDVSDELEAAGALRIGATGPVLVRSPSILPMMVNSIEDSFILNSSD